MKHLIPLLFATVLCLAASPAAAECEGTPGGNAARLVLEAAGVRSGAGEVQFSVYPDDKKRFLAKHGKLARVRVPARQPVTAACIWLPPGNYAIALYHDENNDHDFNHTLFFPKEGYGFSNDAPATVGLPSFTAARFALPAGGRILAMKMRYP